MSAQGVISDVDNLEAGGLPATEEGYLVWPLITAMKT